MVRIGRGAVLADRRARGIVRIEPVVAFGAQAAELAEPECVVVPSMRRDVVGDGRWRDAARFQAEPTQWFDHELMRSAACPAGGAVPTMDIRTMRHWGKSLFKTIQTTACARRHHVELVAEYRLLLLLLSIRGYLRVRVRE
jgi:hypothetical protein